MGAAWLFCGIYLVYLLGAIWRARTQPEGAEQFYVARRQLGGGVVGLSFYATFFSTNSFIGLAGKGHAVGISWIWVGLVILLFSGIAWFGMARRVRDASEHFGALTLPELFGRAAESTAVQRLAGLVVLAASMAYLTVVFKGTGLALGKLLQLDYRLTVGLVFIVVTVYTSAGGIATVIKTDAIQGGIMLFGSVALLVSVLLAIGGPVSGFRALAELPKGEQLTSPIDGLMPLVLILGIGLAGGCKMLADPRQVTRFYAVKQGQPLRRAAWVSLGCVALGYATLLPVGVLARVLRPNLSPKQTDLLIPDLLSDAAIMPPVLGALILTALVAAAMSSIDSVLLVAGGAVERDLLAPGKEVSSPKHARLAVLACALVTALVGAFVPGDIVKVTAFAGALFGAAFLGPLAEVLIWRSLNARRTLAVMLFGVAVVVLWRFWGRGAFGIRWLHEAVVGTAAGLTLWGLLIRTERRHSI